MSTCFVVWTVTNAVSGANCGAAITTDLGFTLPYRPSTANYQFGSNGANYGSARRLGCGQPLVQYSRVVVLVDGIINQSPAIGLYPGWTATLKSSSCNHFYGNNPPPNPPNKYACINGVCILDAYGIYDTLGECEANCGSGCGQGGVCVPEATLSSWRDALEQIDTTLVG